MPLGICPKCGEDNPAKFAKNIATKNGLQAYCRKCHSKTQRDWWLAKHNGKLSHPRHGLTGTSEQCMWASARYRSKQNGWPFNLDIQDIVIPPCCPVLGIELRRGKGKLIDCSPTLDRIKPELGYVRDNVRVISYRANRMRGNASAAELRLVADDAERLEKEF